MYIFLILAITILILITLVIIQARDKSTKKPTSEPPFTTQPPACTKYKYNTSCLDTCGDKYVNETEKKCYDDIPDGKYADCKTLLDTCGDKYVDETEKKCYDDIPDGKYIYNDGKTLISSCGETENNKIIKGNTCVSTCEEFLHESQDETVYGECKTTCDNYYINSAFTKICLKANDLSSLFEVDNVKITDDFSKFIINASDTIFYQANNEKELKVSSTDEPNFIDLKMSTSGSVYARVYKDRIEILVQDLFNQANVLPKYTISVLQDFLGQNSPLDPILGYEIEEFNFCGEDRVIDTLSQGIIFLKSTVPNEQGVFKKIMYILLVKDNSYELFSFDTENFFPNREYNEANGETFKMHKPIYLGIVFSNISLRQDLFGICFSFTSPGTLQSYLYYRQFIINYYSTSSSSPIAQINLGTLPIYDTQYTGTYEYINSKPTKNIVSTLRLYSTNNTPDNFLTLDIIKFGDNSFPIEVNTNKNVISNIAVGCTITNIITNPPQTKEIVYYVTRENDSILKLNKYKYIKTEPVTSLPDSNTTINEVVHEFAKYSSNAYAYLTSNTDGSILTIGIHDGDTKNLYKYNEVSNTVEQLF